MKNLDITCYLLDVTCYIINVFTVTFDWINV